MAFIPQIEKLQGKYVNLREVTVDDAKFILKLRCDENKSKYIHKTENNLQKQIDYIKNYLTKKDEWYFIIENKNGEPIGTHRIYNVNNKNFTTGSWLMINDSSPAETTEGCYLMMNFAFNILGLEKNCYDIRKENQGIVKYNQFLGAKIVKESDLNVYFEATKNDYRFFKHGK